MASPLVTSVSMAFNTLALGGTPASRSWIRLARSSDVAVAGRENNKNAVAVITWRPKAGRHCKNPSICVVSTKAKVLSLPPPLCGHFPLPPISTLGCVAVLIVLICQLSRDDREFCRSVVVRPESKGETSHRSRKLNGTFCEVPNRAAYTWPHITRDITRILIVPRQFLARFIGRSAQVRICTAAIFILLAGCGGGGGGTGVTGSDQSEDPATIEYPIAYIRRPAPVQPIPQNQQNDLQNPFAFNPGAKLLVRSRADANAAERNITDALFPDQEALYDVKDLAVSPDGKQLVFALHAPLDENLDEDDPDQPSWDIWVYNFETGAIAPVITSKSRSEGSDVAPQFLED